MKHIRVGVLLLLTVFITSCGQDQANAAKCNGKSKNKDSVTSHVPNSMVRNVRQAANGDILVASYKGVFRYDGKSFTNITSEIKSPSFWDVLEDRKGNFWFATKNSGIYYYNGKSFQQFTTKHGLPDNRVGYIYEAKDGAIWFATARGASRYDGKSFQNFKMKGGLNNNDITIIMEDKTGKLWFGTRGDAFYYDGKTFTVFKNKDGEAFNNVWAIIEDRKGSIWLGGQIIEAIKGDTPVASPGIWRYDGSTFAKVTERHASAMIEDKKVNIWTAGAVNPYGITAWKLLRYDAKSLYNNKPDVTEIMSTDKMMLRILEANDGSIWFGSGTGYTVMTAKPLPILKIKKDVEFLLI